MRKIMLWGLAGALAMLLAQSPHIARALDHGGTDSGGYRDYDMHRGRMDSDGYRGYDMYHGEMGSNEYRGYDRGSGRMNYDGSRDYGMGPDMMGRSYENESHYHRHQNIENRDEAARIFDDYINSRHNPNLKLGKIKDEGSEFEADLLTRDNSFVDKLFVDKDTGRLRSAD